MSRANRPLSFAAPNLARGFHLTRPAITRTGFGGVVGEHPKSTLAPPVEKGGVGQARIGKPIVSSVAGRATPESPSSAPRSPRRSHRTGKAGRVRRIQVDHY